MTNLSDAKLKDGAEVSIAHEAAEFDGFFRYRVSNPFTLFDGISEYGGTPIKWDDSLSSGDYSITQDSDAAIFRLGVGTASGAKAIRQQKYYNRYNGAKSHTANISFIMQAGQTNQRQRIGYFDSQNGFFLEQLGTELRFVTRRAGQDTAYAKSAWSDDKLDGSGPSKQTLDVTKSSRITIEFQFSGTVKLYFSIGGKLVLAHKVTATNTLTQTLSGTPHLPLRFEIENLDTVSSSGTLQIAVPSVISEGGASPFDLPGFIFGATRDATPVAVSSTRLPLIAIRLKGMFKSKVNRGIVLPLTVAARSDTKPIALNMYIGTPAALTNPSWVSAHPDSLVEYDISATAVNVTNTRLIYPGFVEGGGATATSLIVPEGTILALNAAGNPDTSEILIITGIASLNTNVLAACSWKEFY